MDWRIAGSYLESCNCDPICPCRMVDGVAGGRSTHGICYGVLTWRIEQGHCEEVALDGLAAVLVLRYDDDEEGSPWSFVLHVDDRGDARQRELLADILLGRLGGPQILRLPWVRKPSHLIEVRAGRIEHADGEVEIGEAVRLRATRPFRTDADVRCVIPGYDVRGEELVADELVVDDEPFRWELRSTCGYRSSFDYASEETSPTGQATPVPPMPQ